MEDLAEQLKGVLVSEPAKAALPGVKKLAALKGLTIPSDNDALRLIAECLSQRNDRNAPTPTDQDLLDAVLPEQPMKRDRNPNPSRVVLGDKDR